MQRGTTMTRHWLSAIAICVIGTGFGYAVAAQTSSNGTLYEGARIIVGDGSDPIDNGAFLVEGNRITQVGRAGQVKAPANAARVSLSGKTVMPAIIDTHTHMGDTREGMMDLMRRKAAFGVGAVLSMGTDPGDIAFKLREERVPGAALLFTAGRGITMPEPGRTTVPYWVTTESEARKAVQELAAQKADIVKIWVDDRNGKYKKLTPELYGAVIDEAHKNKLRVAVHVYYLDDAKGLLKAGVDVFAHGVRDRDVDDEFMALVKSRPNFVLIPNLPNRGVATDLSWLSGAVPADELKKLQASGDNPQAQQAFGIQARSLAKMSAAGVKIALGTDGSIAWSHHQEMEDMVAAGMTPNQVITAATKNGAELLRLSDHGTIAAGKSADFIVLDANPLENITNTRRIADVFLRGVRVDRSVIRTY